LLVGLPDEGKGQVCADMMARVTRGAEWPCEEGRAPQGNAILLSAEDGEGDTVVPRLAAADADTDCVEIVRMTRVGGSKRMFSLVTDLALLRAKIIEVGNVKLVLIDPISAYLGIGKIDSFRTTDVRAVLAPLVALADELKVAIVGIMHFNKKVDVTNALLRISDSLAFGATARHVFAVVDDPENKRKLMVRAKNNLARREIPALAFNFGLRQVGFDTEMKKEIWAPHVLWHPKHVDVSATAAVPAGRSPAARDEAKKFLADFLADGPKPSAEVEEAAKARLLDANDVPRQGRAWGGGKKNRSGWRLGLEIAEEYQMEL
jgi:putative DNA primase/helicase